MHSYLAILEKKEVSKEALIKYFKENDIIVERVYSLIGIIKLVSSKKLNAFDLQHITCLELETKEFKTT